MSATRSGHRLDQPDAGLSQHAAKPLLAARQSRGAAVALWLFVIAPFAALIAAVPVAWGWGMSPLDATMAAVGYLIAGFGIAAGFHRYLTHGSFKARRGLRIALCNTSGFGCSLA